MSKDEDLGKSEDIDCRILAFSDWRVQSLESLFETLDKLREPVDLILYAGDDISRFRKDDRNIFSELAEETRLGKVLAVHGNDDMKLPGNALESADIHDLHKDPYVNGPYVFLGLEGAIEGGPGSILYSEDEIEKHLWAQYKGNEDKIPVVVSHVPPNGILDIGLRFGQRHIGSTSLRSFIEEVEPVLTVCGHCHQFGGRAEEDSFGTIINIASHDDPGAKGRYSIIELNGQDIEYRLTTTDEGVSEEGVDNLLLKLSQVGRRRIQHLIDEDITELEQINEQNRTTLKSLPGSSDWHADMWITEAEAIRNGEIRIFDEQKFTFLNGDNIVLVDIETDLSQDRIWLVGLYSYQDQEFDQIFEKDNEKKLLKSFIDYLRSQGESTLVYYGNNHFDEKCLKHRMDVHGLDEGIALMEDSHDLGIKVQNYLLGEFTWIRLDRLAEEIADYDYKHPEIDGFIVGNKYTRYILDNEEPDWGKLLEYNKDDVLALKSVVDKIMEIINS